MDNIIEKINELELNKHIKLDDIPEIDLYMDQVIQLFESRLNETKRTEDDKILTKTMINNYAKGKLLMKINNKKYTKEHLILMNLIYNLKGGLSINDIKSSLDNIIEKFEAGEEYPIRELYSQVLNQYEEDYKDVKDDVYKKAEDIKNKVDNKYSEDAEFEKNFIMLCSLINMSNMYRRMSEKLIDEYFNKE